ncbi:MAG: phosphopantothenoylcysteine decarboxylase [Planctomycetes bacterium]|nr:phosphopantothenoylcysteine decarboxylase [Planctomycetota bacterium]
MPHNIILGVTGSIAAYKAAEIASKLNAIGHDVTVIMTASAQQFINPLTFRTLSKNQIITHLFEDIAYDPLHVSLVDKADLVIIAPATANIIGKIASGIADDILTCTIMATKSPVLIAPAMDDRMYTNPLVQENIKKLKGLGYKFIGPEKGRLASGRIGLGRLAAIELILKAIEKELGTTVKRLKGKKVKR